MGLFSSLKSQEKLIAHLESTVKTQQLEITLLRDQNTRLTERLLLKNNVPLAHDKMDKQTIMDIVNSANIFEEDDVLVEEISDNRKSEKLDAFAS